MFESIKMFKFSVYYLSIIVLFQVVSQFSNFLKFGEEGDDEKRLVGLRLAAPQANSCCLSYIYLAGVLIITKTPRGAGRRKRGRRDKKGP